MSEVLEEHEAIAIAESIERGDDPYVVPEEMIIERDVVAPIPKTLFAQIAAMTVGEKIKLALKGNRDARTLLIRDPNRLIQRFVLQNPRISDEEVIAIARNRNIDSELLHTIGEHRIWPRNYQVKLALVTNPKTPLATSIHFVSGLMERDLRFLAKSKNVAAAVVSQARRLVMLRDKR